jgi:Protein of unknown function (DUF2851).
MEQLLQYIWKYRLYTAESLKTITGAEVDVIDAGQHNTNSGPDFFNAKVKLDGTVWAGNVEIHLRSSDWMRHGHHEDKAYDSVILNVVEVCDAEIVRSNGEIVPQLILPFPETVREHYRHLVAADSSIPCRNQLGEIDPFLFSSWRNVLLTERLERKTEAIRLLLEQNKQNWEEAFYITLLRSFGMGINSDAFERLARSLPLSFILKHSDSLLQVEAFFFGQAALLNDNPENAYLQLLQREYRFLQNKFALKPIEPEAWRFLRLRPANFPHIRLAQTAALYHKMPMLFAKIMQITKPEEFYELMQAEPSVYWQTHYDFEGESVNRTKHLGKTALQVALINAVVPMMFAFGTSTGQEELCNRALFLLEEIQGEDNAIVRNWKSAGVSVESAFDSQAVIQLQKEYCDKKKCLYCRIGHRILSRK